MFIVGAIAGYSGHYYGYNYAYDSGYETGQADMESYMAGKMSAEKAQSYNDGYQAGYEDGVNPDSPPKLTFSFEEDLSETVYVTDSGSKYHRWGCRYLWNSSNAISLDDAIARGYTACSKCW